MIKKGKFIEALIILFLLFFSAALASFITGFLLTLFSESHLEVTLIDMLHFSSLAVPVGVALSSPALLFLAYPVCLYLKKKNNRKAYVWIGFLTLAAFIYAIPWWIGSDGDVRAFVLFTGTGFTASIFTWIFMNKIKMPFGA